MTLVLRPYQQNAKELARASIRRGNRRILLVGPTGCGKMAVAASIMHDAREKANPCIFVADQRELVGQCASHLEKLGVACGVIMAGETDTVVSRAKVIAKDTLWRRAFVNKRIDPPEAAVVLMDEAHRSLAHTWKTIATYYSDAIVIGMTATPCRTDGRGFGDFYQDLITLGTYAELQELGFLVPCRVFAPSEPDLAGVRVSQGDYAKGQLEERMEKTVLIGDIVSDWKRRAADRVTVAFASGVGHSVHIRDEFRRAGLRAEHVDGKTDLERRADILASVADGRVDVLCNYGVCTTGIDLPILKCAIVARPTKSFALWRQMCGRIQRPYGDFTDALVIDHSGCAMRHGFPDEDVEWSLDTSETIQDRKERKKKERPPKDQAGETVCPECYAMYRGACCPKCGSRPLQRGKAVEMTPGELAEIERKKARKETTVEGKQKFWDQKCLGWAIGTGRKVSAASAMFKKKFGVWPNRVKGLKNAASAAHGSMQARDFYNERVRLRKD